MRRRAVFALLIIFAAIFVVFLFKELSSFEGVLPGGDISGEELAARIRSWGAWAVAGSIGLMVIHSFVPFPAEILGMANGMVFGVFWGVAVTWSGAMLGAYLAFGLSRLLGLRVLKKALPERRWRGLERFSRAEGGVTLLIGRLIPVISFNLINYAAGLTAISWWTFTWATAIGILPLTVLMVVVGNRMAGLPWRVLAILTAGAVAAWLLWHFVFRDRGRGDS
jgi:uncharacterized membrane protein YdjX (TVP38/TMEM64 family)